ncbi:MAG: hypothetical protein CVU39_02965 [Chloroflexi bacterium HGW-Chloroflexi-10]|nr:MAG: hypothetical protein CVU39_02965 [Chloroflexi bacterium HGW-Chloroflexi-10]
MEDNLKMWKQYYNVTSTDEAIHLLDLSHQNTRIVAGATDLILELERGIRKNVDTLIDISRIQGLDQITLDDDSQIIHLGPLVTHNHCASSKLIQEKAFPLAQAAWEVGSPQIRNRGTIAGNLITASPANDTITPLIALNAHIILQSSAGKRDIELKDFYSGVRKTLLQPNEMLVDIWFPAMKQEEYGFFIKFALRRAQAISLVNVTAICQINDDIIKQASITLGAVAPTIIHAADAEEYLQGKRLSDEVIETAAILAQKSARPISDIRGSAGYRKTMIKVITKRALRSLQKIALGEPKPLFGTFLLDDQSKQQLKESSNISEENPIITTVINGKNFSIKTGYEKSLLRFLREDFGLPGTKEGCAEGECGACTIFLDGKAVMACMVPAGRANHANIVTIEGIRKEDGSNHIVQNKFIEEGAVQCGYCTPGFVMSAVKLLEEKPTPSQLEIRQAISGNLCRCTGYYKIISAIEKAAIDLMKED